jgi:hypothetical protein
MAQSALTVTPPNPTPPTNFGSTGTTAPNPPNFTKLTYADWADNTKFDTNPPPYYDDGSAGSLIVFATNVAALASGSGATAGGTENTYPGAASGVVPASTSVAAEGAGTETSATMSYSSAIFNPAGALVMVGTGPALPADAVGGKNINPNQSHASSLSPATNPTFASLTVGSAVSGAGTTLLTCTGTGFVQGCRIWVNNSEQTTTYVSATSLTATINKKREAGTWPVDVKLGGVAVPSTRTITWT